MAISVDELEAARNGDLHAEQALMNGLYRHVYHFIRKRVGLPEVADELCQTVFLKVYENLSRYDRTQSKVETWVFTIARRTLIDYYRREQSVLWPDEFDPPAEDMSSATDQEARRHLDEAYLARLLARLSDEQADVVTLRAINEMSYESIAEIVGKSPESVRQIHSRALRSLREMVPEGDR